MTQQLESAIDLNYRPNSYFLPADLGIQLASTIQGVERRAIYERLIEEGREGEVADVVAKPVLTGEERTMLGRIHPRFMGGEYLPAPRKGEVEIARIAIASTTQDTVAVYARRGKNRICYRVVDEYQGVTLLDPLRRTSVRPLKLEALVDFFLASWDLIGCLDSNFCEDGYPPEEVRAFITDASSDFYAEFGDLIFARVDQWLSAQRANQLL